MESLEYQTFGKYHLRGELGRGGTASVYLATDADTGRDVAIKVAHNKPSDTEESRTRRQNLFLNEAQASKVLDHQNIVSVHEAGDHEGFVYLVMEYVADARTLDEFCQPDTLLELEQVVEIAARCAAAFDHAHRSGIVHRDVKPKNLLLTSDGQVKITDFGIALITDMDAADTLDHTTPGSPLYMSPEQIAGETVTGQSDLFLLGVVIYELLTGKHPFVAAVIPAISNNIARKAHTPIRQLRSDVPTALAKIVDRALKKHPAGRYNTGLDMAGDLSLVFEHIQLTGEDFSSRDRFEIIKDLSFFATFPEAEIWEILNASHWQTFPAKHEVITEGEFGDSFHILVEGDVQIRKSNRVVDVLHRGACYGEIGFVTRKKRMASIITLTPITVMEIRAALIERISLHCQLRFHKAFIDTMAERLLRAMERSAKLPG
jgi:serine/threonine protein kinase